MSHPPRDLRATSHSRSEVTQLAERSEVTQLRRSDQVPEPNVPEPRHVPEPQAPATIDPEKAALEAEIALELAGIELDIAKEKLSHLMVSAKWYEDFRNRGDQASQEARRAAEHERSVRALENNHGGGRALHQRDGRPMCSGRADQWRGFHRLGGAVPRTHPVARPHGDPGQSLKP